MKKLHASSFIVLLLTLIFLSQNSLAGALNLTIKDYGLSIGNSKRVNGIRINLIDHNLEKVNGLNLTFWLPKENPNAVINGLALGLISPAAKEINGFAFGPGVASSKFRGISFGVIGVGGEDLGGIVLGGVGVGCKKLSGFGLGLIGVGSEDIEGIAIGGLGVGSQRIRGFSIGLLGVGCEDASGIVIGGLGVGAQKLSGFSCGVLGVGGQELSGIFFGGLGIGSQKLTGLGIGLGGIGGEEITGVALGGLVLKCERLKYLGTGAYLNAKSITGISIGILNITRQLHGIQLGLINYAGNNPKFLRILPLINMHF